MRFGKRPDMEISASDAFLIAGLGNPGAEYRNSRHNVGFMVMDHLAARLGARFSRVESKALVSKIDFEETRLVLAKPHTYMNLSGQSVGALVRYYRVSIGHILVAYDDVDLPIGTLRLRPGGGSAGQKGMVSIIEKLGTQDFPRLRIGIGRPPGRMEAASYVLQSFSQIEKPIIEEALEKSVDAILTFIRDGLDAAMTHYNGSIE